MGLEAALRELSSENSPYCHSFPQIPNTPQVYKEIKQNLRVWRKQEQVITANS